MNKEQSEMMSQLSTNQLAEWSKWNQDNWLIIVNSMTPQRREEYGGEWGWSINLWLNNRNFVERKKAEGWSANYGEYMTKLWQNNVTDEVYEVDGGEDMPDSYWLSSCTVEVDGESRPAEEHELEYFNEEFAVDIEDAAREYWQEKCL